MVTALATVCDQWLSRICAALGHVWEAHGKLESPAQCASIGIFPPPRAGPAIKGGGGWGTPKLARSAEYRPPVSPLRCLPEPLYGVRTYNASGIRFADRARRAGWPAVTQGRALVAFGRVSAWGGPALCRALCALFGPLGKVLVLFCDPEHRFLGRCVAQVCHSPRLFRALSPVFRVVEDGRRRLGIHSAAPSIAHRVAGQHWRPLLWASARCAKVGASPGGAEKTPGLAKPSGGERRGRM